jgi:protocatechuate 3,4-dioxygenase beta subunit
MFTQMDKVAKNHALMRDGQQFQESIQQLQTQRKLEDNVQSVNEAQDMGEETGKIKDEKKRKTLANQGGDRRNAEEEDDAEGGEEQDRIRDPALGRNIDISG